MWKRASGPGPGRPPSFDEEAIGHLPALFDTASRLCGSEADAQDLTHDTYVRALAAAERYERRTSLRAWLLTILYNLFRTRLRARSRHAEVELDEEVLAAEPVSEPVRWKAVTPAQLDEALRALPLKLREVVVLRDLQGLSYRELSQVLDVPSGTVMSRLYRGRMAVKALLLPEREGLAGDGGQRNSG